MMDYLHLFLNSEYWMHYLLGAYVIGMFVIGMPTGIWTLRAWKKTEGLVVFLLFPTSILSLGDTGDFCAPKIIRGKLGRSEKNTRANFMDLLNTGVSNTPDAEAACARYIWYSMTFWPARLAGILIGYCILAFAICLWICVWLLRDAAPLLIRKCTRCIKL